MRLKFIILFLSALMFIWNSCERNGERRKIKLSEDRIVTQNNQQRSTTIYLEPRERRSIAVMFFQNQTGDQRLQWLQKGLTEMLIRSLSQSQFLNVLSTDRIFEILNRLEQGSTPADFDMDMAAILAKEANVEALLTGKIMRSGNSLKIDVRVHEPDHGRVLKEESVEGPGLEDIFGMVDQLTLLIKQDLQITLEQEAIGRGIAALSTHSLEAWQFYTTGVDLLNKFLPADAVAQFEKALTADSTFMMASLRLLEAYSANGQLDRMIQTYQKLVRLKPYATEWEIYRMNMFEARIQDDTQLQIEILKNQLLKNPEDREANFDLAVLYHSLNNLPEARNYLERVISIDPKYKLALNQLGYIYAMSGDFTKAISTLQQYRDNSIKDPNPYDSLGEIYFYLGDYGEAEQYFKKALKINENFIIGLDHLANVYLDKGEFKKALKFFKQYTEKATDGFLKAKGYFNIAITYLRLGDEQEALQNFLKSLEFNLFDTIAVEMITDIHLARNDSNAAHAIQESAYDRILENLTQVILKENFLDQLFMLSYWHDVRIPQTIDSFEKLIESSDHPASTLRLKFLLTLLYDKAERYDDIRKLWGDHVAHQIMDLFIDSRQLSYHDVWKYYFAFKKIIYRDPDHAIGDFLDNIRYAISHDAQFFELNYRIFLADAYDRKGLRAEALEQLQILGMAEEHQWMVMGPFENLDGFNRPFPPEEKLRLEANDGKKSPPMIWHHMNDGKKDGFINFKDMFDRTNWSVAYGLIDVNSPAERDVQIRIGTDESVKLWLNGIEVWKMNRNRTAILDHDIILVKLNKGRNRILIKVCNRIEDWGFYFRITDEKGIGLSDMQYIAADENLKR